MSEQEMTEWLANKINDAIEILKNSRVFRFSLMKCSFNVSVAQFLFSKKEKRKR